MLEGALFHGGAWVHGDEMNELAGTGAGAGTGEVNQVLWYAYCPSGVRVDCSRFGREARFWFA